MKLHTEHGYNTFCPCLNSADLQLRWRLLDTHRQVWVSILNLDSILKSRDITLPRKVPLVKAMVFPVVMDRCESWTIKKTEGRRIGTFELYVLDKTLESSLDCKELKPGNPKGNQPWIFIGRTDAEAETLIHWPPDVKNWLIGKDPDAGKDWRQEEKGTIENEMDHQLDCHESEQTPGDSVEQGSLAWSRKSWTWLSNLTTTNVERCGKNIIVSFY